MSTANRTLPLILKVEWNVSCSTAYKGASLRPKLTTSPVGARVPGGRRCAVPPVPAPIAQPVMSARIQLWPTSPSKEPIGARSNATQGIARRADGRPWARRTIRSVSHLFFDSRQCGCGMADMECFRICRDVEETPIRSRVIEYHDKQTP